MGLSVVWLGDLGFPYGLAGEVQKTLLCCKGLTQCGVNVTVISRFGTHNQTASPDLKKEGTFENINFKYASGSPYRPKNIVVRNILKRWGVVAEAYIMYKLRKSGQLDAAILQTDKFSAILFYKIISILLGFSLIMLYVELYSSISYRKGFINKINCYLYEKIGFHLLDGIMPISDYLIDVVRKKAPELPILKVPMITDFERFSGVQKNADVKYFLFCGAAVYSEIIVFILKAFELLKDSKEIWLYLIINGQPDRMRKVHEEIAKNKKSNLIKLYSGVSYSFLNTLYANATGLLIPIRQTTQDKARFPHKLGEYMGSGNPIVITDSSEVSRYFKDEESALIAKKYDVNEFAQKMEYILSYPEKAAEIGRRGRIVGLNNFDYKIYGTKIKEFIDSIITRKVISTKNSN